MEGHLTGDIHHLVSIQERKVLLEPWQLELKGEQSGLEHLVLIHR